MNFTRGLMRTTGSVCVASPREAGARDDLMGDVGDSVCWTSKNVATSQTENGAQNGATIRTTSHTAHARVSIVNWGAIIAQRTLLLRIVRSGRVGHAREYWKAGVFRKACVDIRVLAAIEHGSVRGRHFSSVSAVCAQPDAEPQRFSFGYQ